jgi:hypothetical protein
MLLLTISAVNTKTVTAATTADWGDVVNVIYSLYLDATHTTPVEGNVNVDMYGETGKYIYITSGTSIPTEVLSQVAEASATYLTKFKEGIVGAELNIPKSFKIDKQNGYRDPPNHPLYDKDLYFVVTLTQILYDASDYSSSSDTTTTTRNRVHLPFEDFNALFAIGAGVILLGGGIIIWNYRVSRAMKSITSEAQMGSSMREQVIKKDKDTIKELRELTETVSSTEDSASSQTEVKFRRRRK